MSPAPAAAKPSRHLPGHYVLFVFGDVEPYLHGPYPTRRARDNKARAIRKEEGIDAGGIYRLDVDRQGKAYAGSYTGSELGDE